MRIDMKMEKLSQKALERKSNKPKMEKKRRARINDCLNQLKSLILETDNERSRHSKLEKADILEMTVKYLQTLRAYHVHLQQIQPIHQTSHQASHHFQHQPSDLQLSSSNSNSPTGSSSSSTISSVSTNSTRTNNNLAHQANLATTAHSAPLSPALSPQQQLNLQMPLPLPLQLNAAHTHTSPTSQLHHYLQNLHQNHHHHHRNHFALAAAHTAQQISPTAWRPW